MSSGSTPANHTIATVSNPTVISRAASAPPGRPGQRMGRSLATLPHCRDPRTVVGSWQVVVGQVEVSPSSSVGRTRWLGTDFIARVAVRTRLPALGSRPFAEMRVGVQLLLVFPALNCDHECGISIGRRVHL